MTLAPRDQRTLLRIDRSLRKDPAVKATLQAFACRCQRGTGPTRERLSAWHPVLWLSIFAVLAVLTAAFIAAGVAFACAS